MSLTRCRLDEALIEAATQAGATVLRGRHVQALERNAGSWRVSLEDGQSLAANAVFLATGKHDLRGRPRVRGRAWGMQNELVGFKMYFRLAAAEAGAVSGHVELVTYPGGYGGLQPVEGGAVNLCCLVERKRLREIGGGWPELLEMMKGHSPHLRKRLLGAETLLPKALAISSIPYGYVRSRAEDGLWSLGDQAAVIPSFTGDGMSIALHSGCLASVMYLQGSTSAVFQRRLRSEVGGQVRFATMISRGLVWAPTRTIGVAAVQQWPGLLGMIARRTRISETARNIMPSAPVPISS